VLVRSESYQKWQDEPAREGGMLIQLGNQVVNPETGEIVGTVLPVPLTVEA